LSFGLCERNGSTGDNQYFAFIWEQAAAQGIAVTVSTGDSGSAGCDNQNTLKEAVGGLRVSGLASTPYNIAVGGTDYYALINDFSTYVTEATKPSSAAGSSSTYYRTAKGYIPESTWKDSTYYLNNTTISQNEPWSAAGYPSNDGIWAGSGGASNCSTNTTVDTQTQYTIGNCTSGYSKPYWQRGTGVPADHARDLPDVSLLAADGVDGAVWMVCFPDLYNGVTTPLCVKDSAGSWYFGGVGGTSAATPAFAGMLALVQQKAGGRLGQAAKDLYDLYNGSHASTIFHDVTVGNIAVACTSGSPDCAKNSAGYYFEKGYDTATGYDLATGLGSVDVSQLIKYWGTATPGATATVSVTPSITTVKVTDILTVTVSVAGSGSLGTPTGAVTLSGGGYTSSSEMLSSGSYTFTIPAGTLKGGTETLTAVYNADAWNSTYEMATGSTTVSVDFRTPTVTVTTTPLSGAVNSNQGFTVTAAVTGSGSTPTGTVTLTGGGYTAPAEALENGRYIFTIPPYKLAAGTDVLTATYSGDSVYSSGSNSATVVVTVSTFTLSATDVTLAAGAASSNVSTVTVTPAGGFTGLVTLSAVATVVPSGAVGAPTFTGSSVSIATGPATGTIAVVTTGVSASVRRISSKGKTWFRAAGGTLTAALLFFFLPLGSRRWRKMLSGLFLVAAVSFAGIGCGGGGGSSTPAPTKTTATVTVTPAKATIAASDPLSVTVAVTGSSSTPTGTVTLTSGSYSSGANTLASGSSTMAIPKNSLAVGTASALSVTYSGDTNYNSAKGIATVKVNPAATTPGTYTVTVTGVGSDPLSITATATFNLTVQ
jgi:hypothetical protein